MAHQTRSSWSSWVRRLAGLTGLSLLVACQVLVPATFDQIECSEEGDFYAPTCFNGQICKGGKCVVCGPNECRFCDEKSPCPSGQSCRAGKCFDCNPGECGPSPAGAGGASGGAAGEGGSGEGGEGGSGEGGEGGQSGEGGSPLAGQSGKGGSGGGAGCTGIEGDTCAGKGGSGGKAGSISAGSGGAAGGGAAGGGAGQGGAGQGGAGAEQGGAGSGGMAPKPPGKLGEECGDAVEPCVSGLECRDLSEWGISTGPVCTKSCCDSAECSYGVNPTKNTICMPTKSPGGGRCLPLSVVPSRGDKGGVGDGSKGSPCKAPGDCRSGWCEGDVCRDLCCNDSCGAAACTWGTIADSQEKWFSCKAKPAPAPQCNAYVPPFQKPPLGGFETIDCYSNVCAPDPALELVPVCFQACKTNSDCPSWSTCNDYVLDDTYHVQACLEPKP